VSDQAEVVCQYCGKPALWTENSAIYGRNFGASYMVWLCQPCDAFVGCHQNTRKPLGTMANAVLRKLRIQAHAAIDPLWKSGQFRRREVYRMLAAEFGGEVHIGASDAARCLQIIEFAGRAGKEKP
jgi:hypothetical protein